jgi:hypothetical protein
MANQPQEVLIDTRVTSDCIQRFEFDNRCRLMIRRFDYLTEPPQNTPLDLLDTPWLDPLPDVIHCITVPERGLRILRELDELRKVVGVESWKPVVIWEPEPVCSFSNASRSPVKRYVAGLHPGASRCEWVDHLSSGHNKVSFESLTHVLKLKKAPTIAQTIRKPSQCYPCRSRCPSPTLGEPLKPLCLAYSRSNPTKGLSSAQDHLEHATLRSPSQTGPDGCPLTGKREVGRLSIQRGLGMPSLGV